MNKVDGIIVKYDNERKFGFIQTKSKQDIFFHIREFRPKREPIIGERVVFDLGEDKNGRACAINIQELSFIIKKEQEKERRLQRKQAYEAYQERQEQKQNVLNFVCLLSFIFMVILMVSIIFFDISKYVIIWYVMMGLISFIFYWNDKRKARNDGWRTPENTLHTIDVLGGWIGASFAHKLLNHKATKESFRIKFYISIFINVVLFLGAWYFNLLNFF